MGAYRIIKFRREEKSLFLSKVINPTQYDNYASDVDEFAKKIMKEHTNICDFAFVEPNRRDANLYDSVFEFGDYINTKFQSENVIWTFINHILAGLLFLQQEGLHYPFLRKKYTTYQSDKNAFKLLNPFCFPAFIDNVIGTYLNMDIGVSEKREFQNKCIMRNIKEFGIMILALVKDTDEMNFFRNPALIRDLFASFRRDKIYSDKLIDLLSYMIENRSQMTFIDVKNFISYGNPGPQAPYYQPGMNFPQPPHVSVSQTVFDKGGQLSINALPTSTSQARRLAPSTPLAKPSR